MKPDYIFITIRQQGSTRTTSLACFRDRLLSWPPACELDMKVYPNITSDDP